MVIIKRIILVYLIPCCIYFPSVVAEESDLFDLSLEELLKVKVHGSTNRAEELRVVPSAVTVFTRDEIKRVGVDSLDELINLVPGFQSYRTSFSGTHYPFSSRGRRIGFPSSEVLILVDGHRLEEPRTSGAAVAIPKYPLSVIEKVEFIRGSGSAIYGSNAMMGIINISTRANENEISFEYGSFSRKRGHFLSSTKWDDMSVGLYGQFDTDNGDFYQVVDPVTSNKEYTDDPRELVDFNFKFRWNETKVNFQHNQFESNNFYEVNRISNGTNQRKGQLTSFSLGQEFDWLSTQSRAFLSYSRSSFSTKRQMTAAGSFTAISEPSSSQPLVVEANFDHYTELRALFRSDKTLNEKIHIQFGAEYRSIKAPLALLSNNFDLVALRQQNFPIQYFGSLQPTTPLQSPSSREIAGLYLQYQQTFFDSLHLTIGERYDYFSDIDSQLSPRFSLVKEIGNNQSLKLIYAEAFRAPAENELNLMEFSIVEGNKSLKPESVESWELIWTGAWKNTGFALGYFVNHFHDSIVQVETDRLRYANVSQTPTKGLELEFSYQFEQHLKVRATYTYFFDNSALSFREANKMSSVMIDYRLGETNFNLSGFYHGERQLSSQIQNMDTEALAGYWNLSSKISHRLNNRWESFIQFKNLLDEPYLTSPASEFINVGIVNRGREVSVGLLRSF